MVDWTVLGVALIHAGPPTVAVLVTWKHQNQKIRRIEKSTNGASEIKDHRIAELERENAILRANQP